MRLGREFKVLKRPTRWERLKRWTLRRIPFSTAEPLHLDPHNDSVVDRQVRLDEEESFILHPNEFALTHTEEHVKIPNDLVGVVHGRSSWARVGVNPHLGGYIDSGFEGQITLELSNVTRMPIKLRVGKRFCQLALHDLTDEASNPYNGKYQGDNGAHTTRLQEDEETGTPSPDRFFYQK